MIDKEDAIFKCDSLTSKGEQCRSLTHVMEWVDYTQQPTTHRCNYCSSHCPHQDQFHEMKKSMQALFVIMFGIEGGKGVFNSIWRMRPVPQFAHVNYTNFMEAVDELRQQLIQLYEGDEE